MKPAYLGVATYSDYLVADALSQAFGDARLTYFLLDPHVGEMSEERELEVQNRCMARSTPQMELFLLKDLEPAALERFTHVVLNLHEIFDSRLDRPRELERFLTLLVRLFDHPSRPMPQLVVMDTSYDNYIFSKV